jgi:CheY-like chemotaxis protein
VRSTSRSAGEEEDGVTASSQRVLVVDDESTIAHVLTSLLEDHGCETLSAGSAEEGLRCLSSTEVAVVLLDIVLPKMSGLEMLEEIRNSSPDTEVVMMTSHASLDSALQAIRLGAYGYLQKPFDEVESVWLVVKQALERRSLARRNAALLEEQERRNAELAAAVTRLSTLIEAGRTLGNFRSVTELLGFFVELISEELRVDRASVMLLDEATGELGIAASRGLEHVVAAGAVRVRLGEGISGRVAEIGEPILVTDAASDPRLARAGKPDLSDSFICAPIVLSLPIKSWEKVLGVLNVTNRRSGEPFGEEDLAYLSGMSGQVAVALERTRQLEELRTAYESLRRAQAELIFSERVKAVGQIAAGVSHDFNNTLGAILGRIQLALSKVASARPDLRRIGDDLRAAEKVAIQGAETIKRIQGFTRKRADGALNPTDLNGVVHEALEITRPKWKSECESAGRTVRVELDLAELPPVPGNVYDLTQAVSNLIFNAVEAMPLGGTLRFRTLCDGDWVVLEVADTGAGITEENLAQMFKPFFTTKESGHGLGLSVVQSIVQRHGGAVSVSSRIGEGTTFKLRLPPASAPSRCAVEAASSARREWRPAHVLLVDDLEEVRRSYREILTAAGHRVTEASGGPEAISMLGSGRFDVVVTDLGMPEVSGLEVAKEAKRRDPSVPVILLSGWAVDEEEDRVKDAGIDRVLVKPCLLDDLVRAVDRSLGTTADA